MDDITRRVVEFLLSTGKNQPQLSELTGIKQANLSAIMNGRRKAGEGIVNKLVMSPLKADKQYLMTGIKSNSISDPATEYNKPFRNEVSPISESAYQIVEFTDLSSSAGELGGSDVSQLTEKYTRLVPKQFENGLYLAIRISGDSMNDGTSRALHDGDEVLVKEVEFGNGYVLPIRQKLFVITSSEGNVIKQIAEVNRDENYIVCRSFNKNYPDFKVNCSDIFQIFEVVMIINRPISLM